MKPIEAFIADTHPEIIQRGSALINGELVELGKPNKHALRRLVREHYAAGQEALKGFSKWLVGVHSLTRDKAARITAAVWNTLCMTYDVEEKRSYPTRLIARNDETYSYSSKLAIAHALRYWAIYDKDPQLYEQIIVWLRRKEPTTPQYVLDQLNSLPPYTRAEYKRLLKALEEFKGAPRFPWAWSCLRLAFVWGAPLTEIIHLERAKIRQALRDKEILLRVGVGIHRRVIQVEYIEEELGLLDAFPYEWGIIADLVDPARTMTPDLRLSTTPLGNVTKLVYQRAKVPYGKNWSTRIRWTAAWSYYKKTKSVVGAQQILGRLNTRTVMLFIEELQRREQAAKGAGKETETSTEDDVDPDSIP